MVASGNDFYLSSQAIPNFQSMGSDRGGTWPKPGQSAISTSDSDWSRNGLMTYPSQITNQDKYHNFGGVCWDKYNYSFL